MTAPVRHDTNYAAIAPFAPAARDLRRIIDLLAPVERILSKAGGPLGPLCRG
jgi:hypothetical protein